MFAAVKGLFRGRRLPTSGAAPVSNSGRYISYLDMVLDDVLTASYIQKVDDIYSKLDKISWTLELEDVLRFKKYTRWVDALTTYKDDPVKLAIVIYVLVKLMDEDKAKKLHKLVNTPRVHALLLSQLSNTEGAQNERLFFNGTYLLGRLLQDDDYMCDNAPAIIICMLNIIKKYNNSDGIVEYALTVIDILKGCTNTYLGEGSVLRTQLVEGSILRSVDPEQGENVILAKDIIEHVTKMTTIEYGGGRRRRTHRKRRAVKKSRRSRK
jgi:hypothetical protein